MKLHIGQQVKNKVEQLGMNKSEFGRRINMSRQNVDSIFNRPSVDTELLAKISEVLNYDFFQYYAVHKKDERNFNDAESPYTNEKLEVQLKNCREEMEQYRIKVVELQDKIIKLMEK